MPVVQAIWSKKLNQHALADLLHTYNNCKFIYHPAKKSKSSYSKVTHIYCKTTLKGFQYTHFISSNYFARKYNCKKIQLLKNNKSMVLIV